METISILPPELIRMVIAAVIIISFIFLNAIMMGYAERKIAGHVGVVKRFCYYSCLVSGVYGLSPIPHVLPV